MNIGNLGWLGGAVVGLALATGCGGGGDAPPKTAADVTEEPADDAVPTGGDEEAGGDEETGGDEDTGEEASSDDDTGGAASDDDVRTVLQLVIDDEALDKFLHLGEPGRFPLKVSGSGLPDGLVKATKPVEIVDKPDSKDVPVLVFRTIDVSAKQAIVKYRYDIEGIRGTVVLKKGPHGWELTNSRIVEH